MVEVHTHPFTKNCIHRVTVALGKHAKYNRNITCLLGHNLQSLLHILISIWHCFTSIFQEQLRSEVIYRYTHSFMYDYIRPLCFSLRRFHLISQYITLSRQSWASPLTQLCTSWFPPFDTIWLHSSLNTQSVNKNFTLYKRHACYIASQVILNSRGHLSMPVTNTDL